jgi:hypothetical protein
MIEARSLRWFLSLLPSLIQDSGVGICENRFFRFVVDVNDKELLPILLHDRKTAVIE